MFTHYRTRGFVLHKKDLSEADQLLMLYTKEYGRLEVLAKGIRKVSSKLRSGIEIFYLSEIEFIQGKSYKTLTDAVLIDNFSNLRSSLEGLLISQKISQIIKSLINDQGQDEKVWKLISETFHIMNGRAITPDRLSLIYHHFLWNFLSVLGYHPELYSCVACRKKMAPEDIYFNMEEGGTICPQCAGKTGSSLKVKPDIIKVLRILMKKDWNTSLKLKIDDYYKKLLKNISETSLSSAVLAIGKHEA